MNGWTIFLIAAFIIISMIPDTYETYSKDCKRHVWDSKPSGYEGTDYLVCKFCGKLPGTDDRV